MTIAPLVDNFPRMRKIALALAISLGIAAPAHAMTYFLVSQWISSGNTFCRYGNGTVLNIGVGVCPLSIQG